MPKFDGSSQLCVDYRKLNAKTTKSKFSIPVNDELLEELGNARHFTKLDLRSGYHHPFWYLENNFSHSPWIVWFLVMPFGFTNTSLTFQSLINEVFWDKLRKFILMFCNDILVYRRTWVEHLHHMLLVFQILAAPNSKLLGHIITQDGV